MEEEIENEDNWINKLSQYFASEIQKQKPKIFKSAIETEEQMEKENLGAAAILRTRIDESKRENQMKEALRRKK
jgi:hypothetical protein